MPAAMAATGLFMKVLLTVLLVEHCFHVLVAGLSVAGTNTLIADPSPLKPDMSAYTNKKIVSVIDTLRDILGGVVDEESREVDANKKYVMWCGAATAGSSNDMSETKAELANAKVLSQEQVASMEYLRPFIKRTQRTIAETKDTVAEAIALRTEDHKKFTEDMQTNTLSLRQVNIAIKSIDKAQSQTAFLEEDSSEEQQINKHKESSYVLGLMRGLKDKLEKSRTFLRGVEEGKHELHNRFMGTKGKSLMSMTNTLIEKKIQLTELSAKEARVKHKIGRLEDALKISSLYSDETVQMCEHHQREWKRRQEDRALEKSVLNEAIRYLLQTPPGQHAVDKNDHVSLSSATSFLQVEASETISGVASHGLVGSGLQAKDVTVDGLFGKDAFSGVKTTIRNLIAFHEGIQKQDATKLDDCFRQLALKEGDKARATDLLAFVQADIGKKSSESVTLADEVQKISETMEQLRKNLEDADKLRKQEKAVYMMGARDRATAIKVLHQARAVLQEFYAKQSSNFHDKSDRKASGSVGIVAMIQNIADEIAKEEVDAATQEKHAVYAHAKLLQNGQKMLDEKQQDVLDRVTGKAKFGVQMNILKESMRAHSDEITSIKKQVLALHNQCDELFKFFHQKKQSRILEVHQLHDLIGILSASSKTAPTRSSF